MKYLLLNKSKQAISTNGDIVCETLSDEIIPITTTEKVNVKGYAKAQIVDENLKPENIPVGKTILGVPGSYEPVDYITEFIEGATNIYNNASFLRANAFNGYTNIVSVTFPNCTNIGSSAFYGCSNLTTAEFPMCSYIGSAAFAFCSKLESLYLNVSSVPTLYNKGAFGLTPLSKSTYLGYYGSIYVPASLYEAFTQATNWTAYADRFVSYF